MKRAFRLVWHEFQGQAPMLFLLLGLTALCETASFLICRHFINVNTPARFERLVDGSGIPVAFVCAFVCLIALQMFSLLRGFLHTKSIYALLTLPMNRRWIYLSKLAAALIGILCLWSLQLVLILWYHALFAAKFSEAMARGSLYLSFFRSNFLKTVFPPEPVSALTALMTMFALTAFVLSIAVNVKAGKYWQWIWVLLLSAYHASELFSRLQISIGVGLLQLLMLVLLLVACVSLGIQSLKCGEVSV